MYSLYERVLVHGALTQWGKQSTFRFLGVFLVCFFFIAKPLKGDFNNKIKLDSVQVI